jgi:4-hydroxybenzoate polyprenyltransferase
VVADHFESRSCSGEKGTGSFINGKSGKNSVVPCISNDAQARPRPTPGPPSASVAVTAHRETATLMFRRLLSLVKIEHTLFALPLAFTGSILAAKGMPSLRVLGLVALAFAGARTAAMAFNRLADRHLDALNPRTADREIPSGQINVYQAWALVVIAVGTYFIAAWALNWVCFSLSPVALAILLAYSYSKRFTWLCHLFLGLCLGLAPVAGWLAVTGQIEWTAVVLGIGVLFWVAGFDVIYACQDVEFDRRHRLHSVPAWLGTRVALRLASLAHIAAICLFMLAGKLAELNWPFYLLSLVTCGLLYWEHKLLHPDDLSRLDLAFFNVNSMVSFSLLVAVWFGLP